MDDMDSVVDQLTDQAQRFSAFTGVTRPNPGDRFFLVMGMTGSGKSSFVARCTGKDVRISHGLYSCTDSIDVFDFMWNGRRIYLVDTPGFNDTNRSDIDTLMILATYLGASYANGVRIHGLIMLHPISDNRMSGSSLRNIEMMKAICGFTFYDNLVIATTMWPDTPSQAEITTLENREAELLCDDKFFGAVVAQRANVFRHNERGRRNPFEETASAQRIVAYLIRQSDTHAPEVLQLQREMVGQGKTIGETAAGIAVTGDLYKVRQAHERQLRELEAEMKNRLAMSDTAHAAAVQELKADVEGKLRKAEEDKQALEKSMQDMHEDEERAWKEKLRVIDRQFRKLLAAKEDELRDMEASLSELRKDRARTPRYRYRKQKAEHEDAEQERLVNEARREVSLARGAYQKFCAELVGNIFNGTANGLAAGITSGVIAGAISAGLICIIM